jgi:HEAT repeat protein
MKSFRAFSWFLILVCSLTFLNGAHAKKKRRRSHGPPPTHPVVLWSRVLSESTDKQARKVAAFKLSQYSQPIFQEEVINTLTKCIKDPDVEIKVLCTKALGRAGTQAHAVTVRKALLDQYQADPSLRNTIVRTFIVRQDDTPSLHDTLLDSLKKSTDPEEQIALLKYFEIFGNGSNRFVDGVVGVYKKTENIKVKGAAATALTARAQGQDSAIALLAQCTESIETPLVLTCLSGLQQQAKKDPRAWSAVEKTVESDDPDVLMASLDVINALSETTNPKIAARLVKVIQTVEDDDAQEKAVLALGVTGDHSQTTVDVLQGLIQKKSVDDGTRIAAALVLGKQADKLPDKPREILSSCLSKERSQSLRSACQLGLQELESRKSAKVIAKAPETAQADPPAETSKENISKRGDEKEKTSSREPSDASDTAKKTGQ